MLLSTILRMLRHSKYTHQSGLWPAPRHLHHVSSPIQPVAVPHAPEERREIRYFRDDNLP